MKRLNLVFFVIFCLNSFLFIQASEFVTFVKEGKVYHLVDETGAVLSTEPMTKVMEFYNGYASCIIDKRWHYIDQTGSTFTAAIEIDKLYVFSDGLGSFLADDYWGFMDARGEIAISPQYDDVKIFKEGKCWVKKDSKWFQIDKEGNMVFSEGYEKFHYYHEGVARVYKNEMWGFIDGQGNPVAGGFVYDDVREFFNGKAFVRKGESWGVIDVNGNYIIRPQFSKVKHFFKDGYAVVWLDDKAGLIKPDGSEILPYRFEKIEKFKEGIFGALYEDNWEVYKMDGSQLIYGLERFEGFYEGYAVVRLNDQYGFLNTAGEIQLLGKYDRVKHFVNGYAMVEKDDKWGFIDSNLNEVIPPQYLRVSDILSQWARVQFVEDELWRYVNTIGDIQIQTGFDRTDAFVRNRQLDKDYGCEKGYYVNIGIGSIFSKTKVLFEKADIVDTDIARVKYDGRWAFIDKEGGFVLKDLDNAEKWVNGYARFRQDGLWGVIDQTGKIVIQPMYYKIFEMTKVCE